MPQFGEPGDRQIGLTSILGNINGNTNTQIAFHGVENPYGFKSGEWMSGIHGYYNDFYIYEGFTTTGTPPAEPRRLVSISREASSGWIDKLIWGEFGDMIPKSNTGSSTTHYCSYFGVDVTRPNGVTRGGRNSGFAQLISANGLDFSFSEICSRLQYRGEIQIIDNPADFIKLPVGM